MKDFKKLLVWEKAYKFALEVYQVTKTFPKEEIFGLTSQIRRSSYSMSTNIAEGCGKESKAELFRFMQITSGSVLETENHLMFSRDLHYIDKEEYSKLYAELQEIKKMLSTYMAKLKVTIRTKNI